VAPSIFNWLLSNIMVNSMADELGEDDYDAFNSSQLMKCTIPAFIKKDDSLWWDSLHTKDRKETRRMIFAHSYDQTIKALTRQLGPDMSNWQWGRLHTLEHRHLFGLRKPLDLLFNVGPFAAMGGNETIVNTGFKLSSEGRFPVLFGPTMRMVIDFADLDNSLSVNPTGQSGFFLSDHYDDQARLFNSGEFRKQLISRIDIENSGTGTLILSPR
jgi:penicillin amidase